jgi:heterodisulfide reductase subunit C
MERLNVGDGMSFQLYLTETFQSCIHYGNCVSGCNAHTFPDLQNFKLRNFRVLNKYKNQIITFFKLSLEFSLRE